MKKKNVYFITTFFLNKDGVLERPRTVGFFKKFREAENIIKYNIGDINESNYYNLALIEKVPCGLYNIESEKFWYDITGDYKDHNLINYKGTRVDMKFQELYEPNNTFYFVQEDYKIKEAKIGKR